jgi:hypothetical protein
MKERHIQWQPLFELIVVLMTILGSTIPLYLHTDSKLESAIANTNSRMEAFQNRNSEILEAIRQDMRDFHGRLCAIEERNKK